MKKIFFSMIVLVLAIAAGCTSDATNNKKGCGSACAPCGGRKCSPCSGAKCSPCGGGGVNSSAEYPDVVMVGYHADNCATCKKIGPTAMEVSKKVGRMVKLDFTTDATRAEAEKTAKSLNMTKAWTNESGTGFVVIFNKNRPDDYRKLKGSTDASEYMKLIQEVK